MGILIYNLDHKEAAKLLKTSRKNQNIIYVCMTAFGAAGLLDCQLFFLWRNGSK